MLSSTVSNECIAVYYFNVTPPAFQLINVLNVKRDDVCKAKLISIHFGLKNHFDQSKQGTAREVGS